MELGLETFGNRASFATLDGIQPLRIALHSTLNVDGQALMSRQYRCGIERPDSAHIIPEVRV
jgi:hypothetical protein